ncbi:hypothetical protein [Victivallis sp. Marseille-Q1083]|uniref:hypothetical protein n=1 Tax=Victivallis sp. Marseille-Q1083 TaxID=2717288 RepID=UPI00158C25D8|nr:hypothetical protein [Victivallis sp. Marseille-Q1083]
MRLPDHAVRDQDYEKGFLSVYFLVNQAWTVNGRDENAIRLADSQAEYLTVTAPKWDDYGCLSGNRVFQLDFPLPAQRNPADPLRLVIPGGIRNWSQNAPTAVEIWTGPRLDGHSFVDKMNRNCIIALNDLGDEVETYHYEFPGRTLVSESPTARRRLNGSRPFSVTCRAKLTDGGWLEKTVAVTPHEKTTAVPLPDDEILVGLCVYRYSEDKRENANPPSFVTYKHQPEKEIELLIEEAGTNLIVPWFNPPVASVAAAAEKGIHMMTIYQTCAPEKNLEYTEAGKNYFWLNNNIGEYASYLYQDEHCLPQGVNQSGDLAVCCDFFINDYIRRGVERYHDVYPYIFSTSGSTLANYELAGGVDFMLCELYALGAQNLAWSSAEMRGAARKWQPEFWGGWLAAEWQSCNVPYLAPQKYHMLRVGLYLQYLMGSRIIILESGSQSTQAGEYTQPLDPKAAYPHRDYNSDDEPVKNYKKEMTDFYDFVKSNPRSGGTPETRMASVLGNCGSFVGLYIDWFAAFSQHAQAKQNPNWLYGDPERTDVAVQQTIFPVPSDALGEYRNSWIGGSPYGQCDVVNIDDETRPGDIDRYSFLFYGGWNSMTPKIMKILRSYVENGGTLFISMPHFSTRLDREYKNYTVEDLVGGGDLAALCDLKVVGREIGSGLLKSDEMAIDATLAQEPIAEVVAGEGVETVIAAGERPFLVREKIGDGEIYVLLTWEYAGKESLASSYKQILVALADRQAGDIRVREAERGDNAPQYIAYAVWPEAIYLLNTDCMRERTFIFDDRGRTETIILQPMEFRAIQR